MFRNNASRISEGVDHRYKWIALSNTTLGVLIAQIDASIVLIALPNIFRGIHMDPLQRANSFYLLWMILGFLVVTSVLVVSVGRLGDMYGRVRMYNAGFAIYTVFSLLLSVTWASGRAGAIWLLVMRVFQGVGAAFLLANAAAILTDAFPSHERGMALGLNQIASVAGLFIGLLVGGLLAPVNWRLIFLVSVPVGVFGTLWAYVKLRELGRVRREPIDWAGNVAFAAGLVLLMAGMTYGIEPSGRHSMGWSSPWVVGAIAGGTALLAVFVVLERHTDHPMFDLGLLRIRAFAGGLASNYLVSLGRGGLMFILIIWLQGVWLPLHGVDFARTPLWAGVALIPMILGFVVAGPLFGVLTDRFGARAIATGGALGTAATFVAFDRIPVDFPYPAFAVLLFANALAVGAFVVSNRAAVMNSLPARYRGVGSGMNQTAQSTAQVLSIAIFFTLMVVGMEHRLPGTLARGLAAQGVPAPAAVHVAHLPPVSMLLSAFLGYNPMHHLLGAATLAHLPAGRASVVTGRRFLPSLIEGPFRQGLHDAFVFGMVVCLVAAAASWSRGRHVHGPATGDGPAPRHDERTVEARSPASASASAPAESAAAAAAAAAAADGEHAGRA